MPLPDFESYGRLVYTLSERYPCILFSTLTLASIGPTLAKLDGRVAFVEDIVLDVWELLDFDAGRILNYSYEVYRASEKILWYDPFEHPHLPELARTFPHHLHIPPNIKQNRVPAPGISFERPNLPFLIEEIERRILASSPSSR
ncbi:MAG: DUF6516 family protein [Thermodesulfobacteriota bacterium]